MSTFHPADSSIVNFNDIDDVYDSTLRLH